MKNWIIFQGDSFVTFVYISAIQENDSKQAERKTCESETTTRSKPCLCHI